MTIKLSEEERKKQRKEFETFWQLTCDERRVYNEKDYAYLMWAIAAEAQRQKNKQIP